MSGIGGRAGHSGPEDAVARAVTWLKLNVLAYNLETTFQLKTTATEKPRTLKRTALYLLRSVTTLRFKWLNKAARLVRPGRSPVLRLVDNQATRETVEAIEPAVADAA